MNDVNFVLLESTETQIPGMLVKNVPEFEGSEQLQLLTEEERKSPGLVCAAFARFIESTFAKHGETESLRKAFFVIERLSHYSDVEVQNLLVTEVFEIIDFVRFPGLELLLGPRSLELYNRWCK